MEMKAFVVMILVLSLKPEPSSGPGEIGMRKMGGKHFPAVEITGCIEPSRRIRQ